MELYTLIQLPAETLSGGAVGGVEGGIVAIGASSPSCRPVPVGACESRIQHYLLQTLPVLPLEISHKGIVTFPFRETQTLKFF